MRKQETDLHMARRHVREAERHIGRQEIIVSELEARGHSEAAKLALQLLDTMHVYLANALAHVRQLERDRF